MKTWIAIFAVVAQLFSLVGSGWARPFTRIVSPVQNQCVPGPDVTIKFEAGGMTLGPSAWNLHFKLDKEPFQIQYDGNHAHVFKNVRPGTHTVRVYAANAMHEAIPGTQSTVSFSVAYPDKANYVMPGQPTLTYNLPQGEYFGIDAADVAVDFLVENATLAPGAYQVAYYVDGRRFLVQDQCGPRHLKDLPPGLHRVRMELQDHNGDLIAGAFNSEEKTIAISPDKVTKSASPVYDGYQNVPRLDSIKGSMTMGQHWSATEPVRPLTKAEIEKQLALTVLDSDGDTVRVGDGRRASVSLEEETPRVSMSADQTATSGEFTVRQGGEPEVAVTDLDTVDTTNVRRGTIVVEDDDNDAVVADEDVVEISDEGVEAEQTTTTRATVRRRADGTTTTLRQTTATLKLEDRPGLRTVETKTSRTVRMEDPDTTNPQERGARATEEDRERRRDRQRSRAQDVLDKAAAADRKTTAAPAPQLD